MEFHKNQDVEISRNNNYTKVIVLQNKSTPGIYIKKNCNRQKKYNITIDGYQEYESGKVMLYIANDTTLYTCLFSKDYALSKTRKTIEYEFIPNRNALYRIGLLCSECKKNDSFYIYKFSITTVGQKVKSLNTKTYMVEPFDYSKIVTIPDDKMYFNSMSINQVKISQSLAAFNRIKKIYNLLDRSNNNEPCLFFGVYDIMDVSNINKHRGDRYILWGGSDIDPRRQKTSTIVNKIKKINIKLHIASSKSIYERLSSFNIPCVLFDFNLVDTTIFKPVERLGDNIFVYNGYKKANSRYGTREIMEVMRRLPQYKYILSSNINVPYHKMPSVYKQCFIGLRLTKYDGNANTVQEMGAMGIPVVHNGDFDNSINWKTIDDIVSIIESEDQKRKISTLNV